MCAKRIDLIARDQGGQLDTTILEMNRLKRELRGRR